ncbi:MAG: ATP-grasp domain-containing protein [Dehalococcoidales bacterium]|nr:ATP-grasp domain-containing protein [Dehalococcoidales bacterium]
MPASITIIYNQPVASYYDLRQERAAEEGVLIEVAAVEKALRELGYRTSKIPLSLPKEQAYSKLSEIKADAVFNLFEGFCGFPETEAEIVDKLECLRIPYTGSPASALRLALDKSTTKKVLHEAGIRIPDFQLMDETNLNSFKLNFPCIIKPNAEDASHSLTEKNVVYDYDSLKEVVTRLSRMYNKKALVEEYIDGREFNITVMGNDILTPLPISEICFSLPEGMPRILTYEAKWLTDSVYYRATKPQCPAKIDSITRTDIVETALQTYSTIGCCGYARVDMRMDNLGHVYVIEVNPNPDISPDAGASLQARTCGMTYAKFIDKILQLAMERRIDY